MSLLLNLLVIVIVLALVYWAIHRIAAAFGFPDQFLAVVDVVLVVLFVLALLQLVLGGGPWPLALPRR